ncbi:formate dehydrogenase accessory sulfurtransferase FdhD [Methanobacterium aggregans]|uniref:formate dehydrogenase accessory sulfurtransferase FdhD n=1 Tax=Methanobacterium aggregans TaxID=1615586 RepID=UPI001AEB7A36|nr:formate dehydrogenase accessory sulfurtransferase FdhD [Methanobacterium aggregans]MBP2046127.1 formate dehydrogenase accessory protein FdhD [Methanobacterium aggregans]
MSEMFRNVKAIRVGKETFELDEKIVNDEEIEIIVNELAFGRFSVSPTFLKEFALGYLAGEGLIDSIDSVKKIDIDKNTINIEIDLQDFDIRREMVMSSDCFGGWRGKIEFVDEVVSDYTISKDQILESFKKLREESKVWKETGGTHIAALVTEEEFITIEDVSRHVAIDKVMGAGLLKGLDFSRSFIVSSGRMPSDMVMKVARMGIPVLTSKAAPTASGFMAGEESGLTIVGFVRGGRFNIYTHPERISF